MAPAVAIYGHDVHVVSAPAMLDRELVACDRARHKRAKFDAQRTPRSAELAGSGALRYGELTVDPRTRMVIFGSAPVRLRRREYALLLYMAHDPERVWTRHELLRGVWGYRAAGTTRTADTHAGRVRRALAVADAVGWVPSTWGVGYRLAP